MISITKVIYLQYLHSHPHLDYIYPSLHDGLLLNTLFRIEETIFREFLIKAIKIHKVAKQRKHLICKYYRSEYGIIRNSTIGIPHVLALILYTSHSNLCTAFRQTYRKMNGETTKKNLIDN